MILHCTYTIVDLNPLIVVLLYYNVYIRPCKYHHANNSFELHLAIEGSSSSPPPDLTVYIKEEPDDEGEDIIVKDEPICSEEYEVIFLT